MQFLRDGRQKILRTRLYGDQEFTRFELELLHTPILQRLYNLKQLGFADRVYPDAIHSRFNHIIGATEVVEDMAGRLLTWLKSHSAQSFTYSPLSKQEAHVWQTEAVKASTLAEKLERRLPALRLMALLHDLTHAAFGHTLEDEVSVFDEKHDDPKRQQRFFDSLVAQVLYIWCTEERLQSFEAKTLEELSNLELSNGHKREKGWAEELAASLGGTDRNRLAEHLRDLELAFFLLLHLDFMHNHDAPIEAIPTSLLVSEAAKVLDPSVVSLDFVLHRDMFMIDLVGNTICADLLDYARRDADNAGLRVQFDDRFLRYLCLAPVEGDLSPTHGPCIRTAIQIFAEKMRHDVLSEMSGILKARYLINERILFHPTKCAAGAMLGTAVQLLGLRDLPGWMQVLGDQEFLRSLMTIANQLETFASKLSAQPKLAEPVSWREFVRALWPADPHTVDLILQTVAWLVPKGATAKNLTDVDISQLVLRAQSARNVVWRLVSRRYPKLAYRLRMAHHTGGESDEDIAKMYSEPKARYDLERRIEQLCHLPTGSIFVHCPKRRTSLKVAEVLVVGADLGKAAQLWNVAKVSPEGLKPYQDEIIAIQDMYRSIWQLHAYLDLSQWEKQPLVAAALERELGFPNDRLLFKELTHQTENVYDLLAGPLNEEIPLKWLPQVIERVDEELVSSRSRLAGPIENTSAKLRKLIHAVVADENKKEQLGLPGMEKTS
jgi:HD superfamily phosphohydrolase